MSAFKRLGGVLLVPHRRLVGSCDAIGRTREPHIEQRKRRQCVHHADNHQGRGPSFILMGFFGALSVRCCAGNGHHRKWLLCSSVHFQNNWVITCRTRPSTTPFTLSLKGCCGVSLLLAY